MANVTQIFTLLNTVAKEAIGESAITVVDTSSFVALGNQIFSTDTNIDNFYEKLPDVIGRVWVKYMEITRDDRGIERQPLDFGIILERISVYKIAEAESNDSWLKNPDPYSADKMKDKTDIVVNMLSKIATFSINKVIYDSQLRTAFSSPERMGAFINIVFADMRNGMIKHLNNTTRLAESTAIAQTLSTYGKMHINLLTEYNTLTNKSLTVDTARRDSDFVIYATKRIKEFIARTKELSVLYNVANAERELNNEDLRLHVLSDFASDMMVYAQSNTYHDEFVKLYGYEEVAMWQGLSTDASFDSVSTVSVENGNINITQSGVIAHLFAKDKVGVMIDHIRTKSDYIATAERTLYSHKADIGYFVLPDEIDVVFYMAEDENDKANNTPPANS